MKSLKSLKKVNELIPLLILALTANLTLVPHASGQNENAELGSVEESVGGSAEKEVPKDQAIQDEFISSIFNNDKKDKAPVVKSAVKQEEFSQEKNKSRIFAEEFKKGDDPRAFLKNFKERLKELALQHELRAAELKKEKDSIPMPSKSGKLRALFGGSYVSPYQAYVNARKKDELRYEKAGELGKAEKIKEDIKKIEKVLNDKEKMAVLSTLFIEVKSATPENNPALGWDTLETILEASGTYQKKALLEVINANIPEKSKYLSSVLAFDNGVAVEALALWASHHQLKGGDLSLLSQIKDSNKLAVMKLYQDQAEASLSDFAKVRNDSPEKTFRFLSAHQQKVSLENLVLIDSSKKMAAVEKYVVKGKPVNFEVATLIENDHQIEFLDYFLEKNLPFRRHHINEISSPIPLLAAKGLEAKGKTVNVSDIYKLNNENQLKIQDRLLSKKLEIDKESLAKINHPRQVLAMETLLEYGKGPSLQLVKDIQNDHQVKFMQFVLANGLTIPTDMILKISNDHQVKVAGEFFSREGTIDMSEVLKIQNEAQIAAMGAYWDKGLPLDFKVIDRVQHSYQASAIREVMGFSPQLVTPTLLKGLSPQSFGYQLEFLRRVTAGQKDIDTNVLDLLAKIKNQAQISGMMFVQGLEKNILTNGQKDKVLDITNLYQLNFLKALVGVNGLDADTKEKLIDEFFVRMRRIDSPYQVWALEKAVAEKKKIVIAQLAYIDGPTQVARYFGEKSLSEGEGALLEKYWNENKPRVDHNGGNISSGSVACQWQEDLGAQMGVNKPKGWSDKFNSLFSRNNAPSKAFASKGEVETMDDLEGKVKTANFPGIPNLGNTCFANSTLKLLAQFFNQSPERRKLLDPEVTPLVKGAKESQDHYKERQNFQILLGQLMEALLTNREEKIRTITDELFDQFHRVIKNKNEKVGFVLKCQQGDPEEFFTRILDLIDFSHSDFMPQVADVLKKESGKKSVKPVAMHMVQMEVQDFDGEGVGSIQNGVSKAFSEIETVDDYYDEETKKRGKLDKGFTFLKAPQALFVQEKRTGFNKGGKRLKDKVEVNEELRIRIRNENLEEVGVAVMSPQAAVVHEGSGAGGGHYYAYLKEKDGSWTKHNDGRVHSVFKHSAVEDMLENTYLVLYEFKKMEKPGEWKEPKPKPKPKPIVESKPKWEKEKKKKFRFSFL